MLVGLRIISILYDLFLASILFYRPFSKINMKKKPLIALFFILIFHGELVFLFSESRVFLVSNLLLNILEYYLIGLNFDYPIRQSSFWILLQTSLSLLAGAVLNQGIQLILPLGELSKNLEAISLYLGISFFLSTGITLILRKLLLSHQRLRIATLSVYRSSFIYFLCFYNICYSRRGIWSRLPFNHFSLISHCIDSFLSLF